MTGPTLLPLLAGPSANTLATPTAEQRLAWPMVLVSMPFMSIRRPSIQLGLLKAILAEHGYPVRTLHANLDFAARVGAEVHRVLGHGTERMAAEWLFSVEAFGTDAPDPDGRMARYFAAQMDDLGDSLNVRSERLLHIRRHDIPQYLDALMESEDWAAARVVGFTSTFQQNTASFALARRLKERFPELVTVFGGANFDGEMGPELVRAIPCVDYAVVSEGDVALPALLGALATGADPSRVPGVVRRVGDSVLSTPPAPPLRRLDDLPDPDYDEYFERVERLGLIPATAHRQVMLPFESARGCWWGAKHHCTFCGLNGTTMEYRSKSPERVAGELARLARRYRTFRFEAVDNILDTVHLAELLPKLIEDGTDYELFYEIKANVSRAQVKLLADAGVRHIQPGIESLSTRVLKLMRKGVRASQNVNLLRWAGYYGIKVAWNILYGFPGETAADYAEQAAIVPHLVHLRPPLSVAQLWLERFSPLYTGDEPGVGVRVPLSSYRHIYPASVDMAAAAYFFEYQLVDPLPPAAYTALETAAAEWMAAWEREKPPTLRYWSSPGFLQIYDSRHEGAEGTYTFEGELADIYLACVDRPIGAAAVAEKLGGRLPVPLIEEALGEFAQRGLVFRDGSLTVALAMPAGATR